VLGQRVLQRQLKWLNSARQPIQSELASSFEYNLSVAKLPELLHVTGLSSEKEAAGGAARGPRDLYNISW
jgi:hypothetical protein